MIPRDSLSEDAAEWNAVAIEFPRLADDSESSCPAIIDEILECVRMESADTDSAKREQLEFLRTAQVADRRYWIWKYTESDGVVCYGHYSEDESGNSVLSLAEANGLSPEQFILADYYDEVYW